MTRYAGPVDPFGLPEIVTSSIVAWPDWEPIVRIDWGDQCGQWSVAEAREFALNVLNAAEAAEHDSAFVRFQTDLVGLDEVTALSVLRELREQRGARRKG